MPTQPISEQEAILMPLLSELRQRPDAGSKLLDLATALANQGRSQLASFVELQALALDDPETSHRWRMLQARRAPANQFLLLNNAERTSAFQRAFSDLVSPGDLVLEIGTGSGILAMLAAKAGAAQVITCERQPLMARVAQAIAEDNQLARIVTVVSKSLDELQIGTDLPDRADVLVSDMFTGALLEAGGLHLLREAKQRLTSPACQVIPAAATLRGRLVGGKDIERLCRTQIVAGLDMSRFDLFSPPVIPIQPERFETLQYQSFSPVIDCFHFNFNTLEGFQPSERTIQIKSPADGLVTGFMQWLKLEISPGNVMESDETSKSTWSRYLHVFPTPISLAAGETLRLHIEHDLARFSVWPQAKGGKKWL